jgi:Putative restriction endonuclease
VPARETSLTPRKYTWWLSCLKPRSKQDEGQKLLAYQDAGIPEYWMVDVAARGSQDTPAQTKPKPTPQETHSKDRIALQAFPDVTIPGGESLLIAPSLGQGVTPPFFPTIPFLGMPEQAT